MLGPTVNYGSRVLCCSGKDSFLWTSGGSRFADTPTDTTVLPSNMFTSVRTECWGVMCVNVFSVMFSINDKLCFEYFSLFWVIT